MSTRLLAWNVPLSDASRIRLASRSATDPILVAETGILLICGAVSAATVLTLEFKWKMPGHSILRAVFPMALGLALVPRRGAGTVMGAGAVATAAAFMFGGWGERGLGALTSLSLIGPFLDLAVRRSTSGRRVYISLVAAGVLTNLAAMSVQLSAKYFGLGGGGGGSGGGKSLTEWLPMALITYPLFGALAGLLSAAAWFRWKSAPREEIDRQP